MNCFYHPGVAAVGICKSCSKGLCPSCAVDLGKGIACRNYCEEDAASLIRLIESNIKRAPLHNQLVDSAKTTRYLAPAFNLILGLFFIAFAGYAIFNSGFDTYLLFVGGMGALFLVFGMISLIRIIILAFSNPK